MSNTIYLSNPVRQNLLALQNTTMLMGKTQRNLATGLKVNSALDNPNSYFTADNLNARASDLDALLDDMGQSVQILKTADQGIQSITELVHAAKATARLAIQTTSNSSRDEYITQYNELLGQIEDLAEDAGYKGVNLLAYSTTLKVIFNEDSSNSLQIDGVDYTDIEAAFGLKRFTNQTTDTDLNTFTFGAAGLRVTDSLYRAGSSFGADFETDGETTLTLTDTANDNNVLGEITTYMGMTIQDLINEINSVAGGRVQAKLDDAGENLVLSGAQVDVTATGVSTDVVTLAGEAHGWTDYQTIETVTADITETLKYLRSQASTFGTNLTVVENRQNFTLSMINTLEEGAGKLILADTNEEGANLLALQTRQQLSSTSLSFASQADQNVLRLFG